MKIALIGYGNMGQLVEHAAQAKGHQIIARFSRRLGRAEERQEELAQADLAIDFSHSSLVLDHLKLCLSLDKPLVIGTTGWEKEVVTAKTMVVEAQGSCLYAPNFSIGMCLFQRIVAYAASLMAPFEAYDVCGVEYHHQKKLDAPSGSAKGLTQQIINHIPRLPHFAFSSIRCGQFPGTHTLHFDSADDTLTFTHQARNRQGFAQGVLMASEWLLPRRGFFALDDLTGPMPPPCTTQPTKVL